MIRGVTEDLDAGLEAQDRAGAVGGADDRQRRHGHTHPVFLPMDVAIPMDDQLELLGQRVDDGHADAVQTARDLVGIVVELAASMEHGHDHFGGGAALLRVHVHRNAAAVIGHRDGVICMKRHGDAAAVAGERLVDGVVDDFEHHMVQSGAIVGVADVHPGTLSDRIEALEDLDISGVVSGCAHALMSGQAKPDIIAPA